MANFRPVYSFSFLRGVDVLPGETAPRYKVSFLRDGFLGNETEILPGGEPAVIKLADSSDNIFEPILSQTYTFDLVCQAFWQAQDFYVRGKQEMMVLIQRDATGVGNAYQTIRRGWLVPGEIKEDFSGKPYKIQITATCGLPLLKNVQLLDKNGKRLQGLVSEVEVVRTALLATGLGNDLVTGVNLYETSELTPIAVVNGLANPALDPMRQSMLHADTFLDDDGVVMFAWDALLKVLKRDLRLTQHDGKWYLFRVPEMAGNWDVWNALNPQTIHLRSYVGGECSDPPTSHYSQDLTAIVNGPDGRIRVALDPSQQWKQQVVEGVRIEQTFGRMRSKFPDFSQVDGTGLPIGWKNNNIVTTSRFREGDGSEEDPWRLTILGGTDNLLNNTAYSVSTVMRFDVNSWEAMRPIKRTITGEYRLTNTRAAQYWALAIAVERNDKGAVTAQHNYLLLNNDWKRTDKVGNGDMVKNMVYNSQEVQGKIVANPGWAPITIEMPALSGITYLEVCFGMAEELDAKDRNPNVPEKIEYRNLRMLQDLANLNLNGQQQTIVNPGKKVKEPTLTIELGDVPDAAMPYGRLNTLFKRANYPNEFAATLYHRPDWPILPNGSIGLGGKPMNRLSWVAQVYARQLMEPADTFEGDLYGHLPFGPLSVPKFADAPELGSQILTRWKWTLRTDRHSITGQRLLTEINQGLSVPVKEWQTPGGPIMQNDGDDGQAVTPVEKPLPPTEAEKIKKVLEGMGIKDLTPGGVTQPGFNPIPGGGGLRANVYNNGQLKSVNISQLKKQVKFKFPQ